MSDLLKRAFYVKCTLRFVYYEISFVETTNEIVKDFVKIAWLNFVKRIFIKYYEIERGGVK